MTLYQVLGVQPNATMEDIKKNFRKLSKTMHPDISKEPDANERFVKINEAYEILMDEYKRKEYDQSLKREEEQEVQIPVFDDVFKAYFANQFHSPRTKRGEDITVPVSFSATEALIGAEKTVVYQRNVPCAGCEGEGYHRKVSVTCTTCHGKGNTKIKLSGVGAYVTGYIPCEDCEGYGRMQRQVCHLCHGSGVHAAHESITLAIPHVQHQPRQRIKSMGHTGYLAPSGDLWIEWRQDPADPCRIEGNDVYVKVSIPFKLAVLGGSHKFMLPNGMMHESKVWPGTSHGDLESIAEVGFLNPRTNKRGFCYVEWVVQTPRTIEELSQVWKGHGL